MDFNLPITYQIAGSSTINLNSIAASEVTTSSPLSGYKVLSATFGDVTMTGYVDKRALHDGVDAGDTYLGTKTLSIVCGVFGSSIADFHDRVQALLDASRPVPREYQDDYGFRNLAFSQATIDTTNFTSGYIPMQMKVRPVSIPAVQLSSAQSIGVSSKGRIVVPSRSPHRRQRPRSQTLVRLLSTQRLRSSSPQRQPTHRQRLLQ